MCTCAGIAPGYPQHESYCGTDPAELWDRYDEQFETYIADPANDPGEDFCSEFGHETDDPKIRELWKGFDITPGRRVLFFS